MKHISIVFYCYILSKILLGIIRNWYTSGETSQQLLSSSKSNKMNAIMCLNNCWNQTKVCSVHDKVDHSFKKTTTTYIPVLVYSKLFIVIFMLPVLHAAEPGSNIGSERPQGRYNSHDHVVSRNIDTAGWTFTLLSPWDYFCFPTIHSINPKIQVFILRHLCNCFAVVSFDIHFYINNILNEIIDIPGKLYEITLEIWVLYPSLHQVIFDNIVTDEIRYSRHACTIFIYKWQMSPTNCSCQLQFTHIVRIFILGKS